MDCSFRSVIYIPIRGRDERLWAKRYDLRNARHTYALLQGQEECTDDAVVGYYIWHALAKHSCRYTSVELWTRFAVGTADRTFKQDNTMTAEDLIKENDRRNAEIYATFNPLSGEGSTGNRVKVSVLDFPGFNEMYLPVAMLKNTFIRRLMRYKTINAFIEKYLKLEVTIENRDLVIEQFVRLRIKHDFPFWAATFVKIKPKKPGPLIYFWLNRPQRILVEKLEKMRLAHEPIRIVVLKARQWGGSTCIQMYMAWMQLVHLVGASSAIEAHQNQASSNIQKMFKTMLDNYPARFLHEMGEEYDENEKKWKGDPVVRSVINVPSRDFEIQVGSAMNPDSSRSSNVALAHLSEVAIYPNTEERTPQKLVQAIISGILAEENTFVAYESTAKGEDNYFHDIYIAAKKAELEGDKNFLNKHLFISWHQIPMYSRTFMSDEERIQFAIALLAGKEQKEAKDIKHEPGAYLYWLWEKGATLEAINWYILKRTEYDDHADMANEFPSDDIEAFRSTGCNVFDIYDINEMEKGVRDPKYIGDVHGDNLYGPDCLKNVYFKDDQYGKLKVWEKPEIFEDCYVYNRYVTIVDIGGRWKGSDWSVITVIDRYWMSDGGKPRVVAQWVGHIDHDLLAWKAAQIAKWYDNALLVVESNTLEKEKREENEFEFILNEIKAEYENLYQRKQSAEDIRQHAPVKYGFHTNVNTKPSIIAWLIKLIRQNAYIERDAGTIDEFKHYQLNEGVYEAAPKHHDDKLMTRAIGLWICYKEMEPVEIVEKTEMRTRSTPRILSEATIN